MESDTVKHLQAFLIMIFLLRLNYNKKFYENQIVLPAALLVSAFVLGVLSGRARTQNRNRQHKKKQGALFPPAVLFFLQFPFVFVKGISCKPC